MTKNPQVWHWSATLLVIVGIGLFSFYFSTQFIDPNSRLSDIALAGSYTQPVDGVCGSAAKDFSVTDTDWGSSQFCSAGDSNPGFPAFPRPGNKVTWTCSGKNGGKSSPICTATRSKLPPFDPNTPVPTSGNPPGYDPKPHWYMAIDKKKLTIEAGIRGGKGW